MRPGREDIAAPELPPTLSWIGPRPKSMPVLTAPGPALVHFFELGQLNSVRTLPYVAEWARRYSEDGLTVIGVQAPRFPFAAEPEAVAAGLARLGIELPRVAVDSRHDLWTAYGCEGWPSLFLWKLGGSLTWVHFGEGEYRATEEAIQEELRDQDALRELPEPMAPLRPTDSPGARVIAPTPEQFPGGSYETPWVAGNDGEVLALDYQAGGAYATVEGEGELLVELDGAWSDPIPVAGPGLVALAEHPRHEAHDIVIRPAAGIRVWSLSFAPGVP